MADTQEAPVHALLADGTTAAVSRARRAAGRVAEAVRHPGYRTPAGEHEGRFVGRRRVLECGPEGGRWGPTDGLQ
jgi:hypothetical protein